MNDFEFVVSLTIGFVVFGIVFGTAFIYRPVVIQAESTKPNDGNPATT